MKRVLLRLWKRLFLLLALPFRHPALSNGYAFLSGVIVAISIEFIFAAMLQGTTLMSISSLRWTGIILLVSALGVAAISVELEKYKEDLVQNGNPTDAALRLDILKGKRRLSRLWAWASLSILSASYGFVILVKGECWPF